MNERVRRTLRAEVGLPARCAGEHDGDKHPVVVLLFLSAAAIVVTPLLSCRRTEQGT